jgi:hypothetical protein
VACGLFFGEQRPVVAERSEVEELEPGEHRIKGSPGHTQVIADVKEVILDFPLGELIGGDLVISGQLVNGAQILASGTRDQSGELHVPDHAFSEFGHRDTLSCMGPKNSGHNGRKPKGIRPELSEGYFLLAYRTDADRSPHPAAKPLRPMAHQIACKETVRK